MGNKKQIGILWISVVLTVFAALAITLALDITLNTGDMEKTLNNVYKYSAQHITELIFDTASNIILIIVSLKLYLLFNKNNRALFGSIWFILSGFIMIIHNMGNFAVTWIAADYYNATGTEAEILKSVGYSMLLTAKWGVTLASFFFVLGVIVYCILLWKISRGMAFFGLIAGAMSVPALAIGWFGPQYEMLSYRLWGPMLLWQITFGVWLIFTKVNISNRFVTTK